jgi:hypothetical protein
MWTVWWADVTCASLQVITELLHLSRNPETVKQIADEKEKAFQRLRAGRPLAALPGAERLLQTLVNHGVRPVPALPALPVVL